MTWPLRKIEPVAQVPYLHLRLSKLVRFGALTIALPSWLHWLAAAIVIHGPPLQYKLESESGHCLRRHEETHVRQAHELGFYEYWCRHIGMRNGLYGNYRIWRSCWRTGWILELEAEAYVAGWRYENVVNGRAAIGSWLWQQHHERCVDGWNHKRPGDEPTPARDLEKAD